MKLTITIKGENVEIELYDFQFWNQRFFCRGNIGDDIFKFISTSRFENLLINDIEGIEYKFKPNPKFNPYTTKIDRIIDELNYKGNSRIYLKSILRTEYITTIKGKGSRDFKKIKHMQYDSNKGEIVKVWKRVKKSNIEDPRELAYKRKVKTGEFDKTIYIRPICDIGPNEFSGKYINVYCFGKTIDNLFFETIDFIEPEFYLYKYQTNINYRNENRSVRKDGKPKILTMTQISLFATDPINRIIHAVKKTSDENDNILIEDFFNTELLTKIFQADIPTPGGSTFRTVLRIIHDTTNYTHINTPIELISYDKYISKIIEENDKWIHILNKGMPRHKKYELRYFYEYKRFITPLLAQVRRRTLDPGFKATPKGVLWLHKLILHRDITPGVYNLVYYQNDTVVNELEELLLVNSQLSATPLFQIKLQYNFEKKRLMIDGYNSKSKLYKEIEEYIGISQSIILKIILANMDKYGVIELGISKKKGISTDKLRLYTSPYFYTLVNLYDIFNVFGQCSGAIRAILSTEEEIKRNEIRSFRLKALKEIYQFEFHSIPKNPFSDLIFLEINDHSYQLNDLAINIPQAIDFIINMRDIEYTTDRQYKNMKEHGRDMRRRDNMKDRTKKLPTWYASANRLILFESEAPLDIPTFEEWRQNETNHLTIGNPLNLVSSPHPDHSS
jgi:hypothetical protein